MRNPFAVARRGRTPDTPASSEQAPTARLTEVGAPELVDPEPHTTATVVGIVGLIVVMILGLAGLGSLMDREDDVDPVDRVVVPRLASRTMTEAQTELERLGLLVDVRFEPNEIVRADIVVDQEPIAGARLDVGEQVTLVVSDGPMGVTVPNLTGSQLLEASRTLEVLGLRLSTREIHDEDVAAGQIVRSDPSAGSRAVPGATVTVAVSLGPAPRTVPEVVGQPSYVAFARIGRADLQIGRVSDRRVDEERAGTVVSVDPPAGTELPRDQPIRVVIGRGPADQFVPDVVGLSDSAARSVLSSVGLQARVRTQSVPAGDRRAGRVIAQTPIAGTTPDSRGPITLTVGVAAAPPPDTGSTTTAPP